jgi:N-formylglutamate deformylase
MELDESLPNNINSMRHDFWVILFISLYIMSANFVFVKGTSPIVATAIHEGHQTRSELKEYFNLSEEERLREEDPFISKWLHFTDNGIVVHHSRFEVDVNRPREKAIYKEPEDAWGLKIWKKELPEEVINTSIKVYDEFYRAAKMYFDNLFTLNENIIVYDLHSYNHRRQAPDIVANPAENPDINIGTENMDREFWHPVIRTLTDFFNTFNYDGRILDARENIKFKGGYFGKWLYGQYGKNICPISIEIKKIFMDEHTGQPYWKDIQLIGQMLEASKQPVLNALGGINPTHHYA